MAGRLLLALVLLAAAAGELAAAPGGRRAKLRAAGDRIEMNADESVAEQVNDPTAFLRELGSEVTVEHGHGPALVEWTPWLVTPLAKRIRFEAGLPVVGHIVGDPDGMELGDAYAQLAYIFASTEDVNYLANLRLDFPTGNAERNAGEGVTQWHLALGSVIYRFEEDDVLLMPWIEYRRSLFGGPRSQDINGLLGSLRVVYLLTEDSYVRAEGTLHFDETLDWQSSGVLTLELGHIFFDRYSVALGYGLDLWGDSGRRNAANVSVSYLF
jgi:hypothetical protein